MARLTKASFAAAKRRLGIKKVTKKNIGRIARAARKGITRKKSRSKPRVTRRKTTKRTRSPKKGGRTLGNRKSIVKTVYKLAPALALAAPGIAFALQPGATPKQKISRIAEVYSGFDIEKRRFNPGALVTGYGAFLGTSLTIKGIQKLNGIIRSL